ncbi:hypothetical protein PC129_g17003 [Phytophthora cactorum]|uniref:Uncharacterized protein n=1 Tax=Phytophthora cactorum TaxID=29920 RepID=A0A8T1HJH1_9STRA|nr:hypothetical protein PC129_g17003 [Phytophthora cactorum]
MSGKTEKELQIRLKKLQQGNSIDKLQQLTQLIPLNFPLKLQTTRKEISLQQLKKSHQEQIQQNLFTAKEHRKQELAARENIKLSEQIKNNTASRSTFKLSVQGPSPLFRTPEGLSASYDSSRALTVASNLQQAEVSKVRLMI